MKTATSSATTLKAMLALVEEKRVQQQNRILAQAQAEAAHLMAEAHRLARARMKETITQERRRQERAFQTAQAQHETELRHQVLNQAKRQLQTGRDLLDKVLLEQWRMPDSRRHWITSVTERAVAFLPKGLWEVCHPKDLDGVELVPLVEIVQREGLMAPRTRSEETVMAGLRIGCQGAWVDGTLTGLVANRATIDAMLLALLQPEGASNGHE
ncbi:MAG: hypothetical protein H7839_08685 [Magnetococcus sp. YQC-5]